MKKVLKCGYLFNNGTGAFDENKNVFLEGDKIVEISDRPAGPDCEVIDLSGKYVLPGLIDCHLHTTMNGDPKDMEQIGVKSHNAYVITALCNAQKDLMGGFTTIRDECSINMADVAVKQAIASGETWGPRVYASGFGLTATGGHADTHYAPDVALTGMGIICNSPDECRAAARYNFKYGADQIKLMSTGGVLSKGDDVGAPEFTYEEMRAVCELAESRGRITSAHAHAGDGIKIAVRAGITSIEHGTLADEEAHSMMLDKGTWLVATLSAGHNIAKYGVEAGIPQFAVDKTMQVLDSHFKTFRRAYELGIPIAFGTDCGTPFTRHGQQATEFSLMVGAGMSTKDAIRSATCKAAELMRLQDKIGTIEKGKIADIIAVDENPLEEISRLETVTFVMKEGTVYKQ